MSTLRTRWAALGAAVAVTLGAGGIGLVAATSPAEAVTFVPITPCRLFDTRPQFKVGDRGTPIGAGEVHTVSATGDNGNCAGIPTTATAVSTNMTSTNATKPTFLTVWAAGEPRPSTSNINPIPGSPATPNGVIAALNGAGQFSVFNLAGTVHLFADINGYYVDHTHDDRYYTKAETDSLTTSLTGDAIVDGSLTLTDLAGGTEITRTVTSPVDIPGGACGSLGGGNSGAQQIGKLVLFTIADSDGNAVIPNGATAVPSVVIGTSQGGAIIQFLVCNGGTSPFTVPAGSVVSARIVEP